MGHPLFIHHPEILTKCRGVIQVGGARGEEIDAWVHAGIRHQVYFEPRRDAYDELLGKLPKDEKFDARAVNAAISDTSGRQHFYLTDDGQSSSLLRLNPDRVEEMKVRTFGGMIPVMVTTLDEAIPNPADYNLLFIDVQGAEDRVLRGATETLKHMDYVVTEVGFLPMYTDCVLWPELDKQLNELGFELLDMQPLDNYGGHGDAVYIRKGEDHVIPPG